MDAFGALPRRQRADRRRTAVHPIQQLGRAALNAGVCSPTPAVHPFAGRRQGSTLKKPLVDSLGKAGQFKLRSLSLIGSDLKYF